MKTQLQIRSEAVFYAPFLYEGFVYVTSGAFA